MKTKTILRITLLPLIPLSIPLTAMLFNVEGWAWGPGDFVAGWIIMAGACFAYALITGKNVRTAYRFATGLGLFTGFMLVWVNGAVGLIGSEENPANLLYGGVILVGLVGAIVARFQAGGMSRALFATALAQLLVPLVALTFPKHDFAPGFWQVLVLNACFAALFAGSGFLFQHAARQSNNRLGETTMA
ncbi:MAG: hypothetical protein QM760_01440 [Nibricoccus sp.]